MATERIGTLEGLALGLAHLFAPLEEDLKDGKARVLLASLGLQLPPAADGVAGFSNAIQSTATAAGQMPALIAKLIDDLESEDYGPVITTGSDLIKTAVATIKGIADTAAAIRGLAGTGIPAPVLNDFADNLPGRLVDYLVVRNLEAVPVVPEVLEFIGVIERNLRNSGSTDPGAPEFTEYGLHLDQATAFVQSPSNRLRTMYDWGDAGFDGGKLLPVLQSLFGKAGFPAVIDHSVVPPVLDALVFEISAKTDITPRGLSIKIAKTIEIDRAIPFNQGGDWTVEAIINSDLSANTSIVIQPDGKFTLAPPTALASGEYGLRFTAAKADRTPFVIFGSPNGSRLEVAKFILETKAGLNFDAGLSAVDADVFVGGEIKDGKLNIDVSGGDGFLSQILSGVKIESDFGVGFGFSGQEGLFFAGSATLEIQLPAHLDLGPVAIDALTLSAGIQGTEFPIGLSANIKALLGPITAVVEQIGLEGRLSIPANRDQGNLGPLNFDIGFKPPRGVGLAVDAGPVKGGGYLFFDFEREEYAGALELVFSDWIALRAIGLITTRMPDGSKGFSMLIIITVEFGTGIQLGFGFTLLGVGGLLGVHRIVRIEALKDGIRTNAVESVMFPQDIIANAPRIISDLRNFFPVQQSSFLLGPMAKIGWGTPTLVSVSLGIILEIPSINITILGVIKVVLPHEDVAILRLQVNFIGRLEPANKLLWFYAELYDSRILFITLEGGMGLFVHWGDPANFVVSVGGFHPRYTPPPLPFPSPPRLAVNILNESYARVRIEGYFAVTSNSVQFGAHAELFFGVSAFNIEGHLGFDALFQFNPFFFSFGISVSLSVKVFGIGLFSVGFSGLLEGPTPWHIEGHGSISLLFFSISVPFSHTWGDEENTNLDPIDVFPLIEAELNALTNWEARLPSTSSIAVTLRQLGAAATDQLVLHPVGSLRISQRKVPLNFGLDKVGNQRPADTKKLFLSAAIAGGGALAVSNVQEPFAVGQFVDLDDSGRLSSPGFEPEDSGVEINVQGQQLRSSQAVRRVIRYESIIIDNNFRQFVRSFFVFFTLGYARLEEFLFTHFLTGNAVTKSPLSKHHKQRLVPFAEKVEVVPEQYSVAFNEDNTSFAGQSFHSHAQALQFMQDRIQREPALASRLHVIPNTEVNGAP